jgi:hypothetical protein
MKRKASQKLDPHKVGLAIRGGKDAPLSRTQLEFNRLMKSLESTRDRHTREQARLDETLATAIRELIPLIEKRNHVNRDLVTCGFKAWQTLKLSAKRRHWFGDLLSAKASELLDDPVGLSEQEIGFLQSVIEALGDCEDEIMRKADEAGEFGFICDMLEQSARAAGVELDLSDIDPSTDPEEFERIVRERLEAAAANLEDAPPTAKRPRKLTKAQAERERKRLELEEARNRDLKSLFKQLAKAFHPDLEPDPLLKEHKKVWMQRLNTAYAANDLREMLQLEMEWLGEEATNLATAGDEKLKVYCMVLKEQIADLKAKTHYLKYEPQYGPLQRFIEPFCGTLASPVVLGRELREELKEHQSMLATLSRNDTNSRRMIYDWADENERRSILPF